MPPQFQNFLKDRRGNFAVLSAVSSVMLLGAVGLVLDYNNLSNIRSQMQNAADTAALFAARENAKMEAERIELAQDMFAANFTGPASPAVNVTFPAGSVRVEARANVTNMFGVFLSKASTEVAVSSTAESGAPQTFEIAFALDVSGSMNAPITGATSRLAALQLAVSQILDQLQASASANVTIKAAVVPFTNAVNIGTNNASFVFNTNHALFAGTKWLGCVFERAGAATFSDSDSPQWGAYIWPPMPDVLGARDYSVPPSNGTMDGYWILGESTSTNNSRVSGPNYNCTRYPIVPLTADLDSVRNAVSSYEIWTNMGTHIAAGVSWGMRVLSPRSPFSEGADYGPNVHKMLIVVTDGEQVTDAERSDGLAEKSTNSISRWRYDPAEFGLAGKVIDTGFGPADSFGAYGFIRDSQPFGLIDTDAPNVWEQNLNQLADISTMACDEAKRRVGGRQIDIFTLGISDDTKPGTRVYRTLHSCASKPDNHFYVTDTNSLAAAFEKILTVSSVVRLTQ